MQGGYTGKILRVNLSTGSISNEKIPPRLASLYLGGRGLAGKMLADELKPEIDPLGPENKIFIATGPLTGSTAPTSGRHMVVTKSPLNGVIASSNSGGYWGAELKFAGWDMLVIEGRANQPVYISIIDELVEIKDAAEIWGKTVSETTDALLEELGDHKTRILTIGPAGEKLSLNAAVLNDRYRASGRSGVGAVMGSKNLKAVAVRGTGSVTVANPDELKNILTGAVKKIREHGVTGQGLPTYGTAVLVNIINESGVFPTNNFQRSYFEQAEAISGESLAEKYLVKKDPCYRCPIACGRYCRVGDEEGGGPEYETVWVFGADCGINDLATVIKANNIANELGLDTISAGATIAAAMELYQRGLIKPEELGGPALEFGSGESLLYYLRAMGYREGFGDKLALGSYRLCQCYGHPELSMSVKKLDMPAYDPRGIQGHGLQYATANRGGCHVRGYMISPEILGVPEKLDRLSLEGKASWTITFQDLTAVIDSLGLCLFTSFALSVDDYTDLTNAVTGLNYSSDALLQAGDRIWNNERLWNLAVGITGGDDTLPERLLKTPIPDGPSKGYVHRLPELLPEYYKLRGWGETGIPKPEKLASLELG